MPLDGPAPARRTSALYCAAVWETALKLARILPHSLSRWIASVGGAFYWITRPDRRPVVFENILPVVDGDRRAAQKITRQVFHQLSVKLADLCLYESGCSIRSLFGELTGWEHFQAAQARGRGVLLLTIHLGNWEFGAPLLTERGVRLQVITGPEPHPELTRIRQAARARWGIETIALGENPFAVVEIIRRLEANNCVALLMDRPPAGTDTRVTLFGRPFDVSRSAAELARASGCALLPVFIPLTAQGYAACILPEIPYDRPALRRPEARLELTQRIITAFEPAIRQHPDQWYHFVPIWPAADHPSPEPGRP